MAAAAVTPVTIKDDEEAAAAPLDPVALNPAQTWFFICEKNCLMVAMFVVAKSHLESHVFIHASLADSPQTHCFSFSLKVAMRGLLMGSRPLQEGMLASDASVRHWLQASALVGSTVSWAETVDDDRATMATVRKVVEKRIVEVEFRSLVKLRTCGVRSMWCVGGN